MDAPERERRPRVCGRAGWRVALMGSAAMLGALALLLLLLVAAPGAAHAQARSLCPAMRGGAPSLAGVDASVRLGFIQRQLRRGAARSRAWAGIWGATFAAASLGQFVRLAVTEGTVHRAPPAFSAAAAALGVAFVSVLPPAITVDSRRLDARVALLGPRDDVCRALAAAERYLVRDAQNQAGGLGWPLQVVTGLFSVGLGLTMWLVFDDWKSGLLQTVMGVGASQLMNLTRPTDAIAALRRYRAGDLRPAPAPSTGYWIVAPVVGQGLFGAGTTVGF